MTLVHVVLDRAVRRASSDVAPGPRSARRATGPDKDKIKIAYGILEPSNRFRKYKQRR